MKFQKCFFVVVLNMMQIKILILLSHSKIREFVYPGFLNSPVFVIKLSLHFFTPKCFGFCGLLFYLCTTFTFVKEFAIFSNQHFNIAHWQCIFLHWLIQKYRILLILYTLRQLFLMEIMLKQPISNFLVYLILILYFKASKIVLINIQ